jgi:hypothetical protein
VPPIGGDSVLGQLKARPADGLVVAQGTAAGTGEAVPFLKDKAALPASGRDDVKVLPGSGGPSQVDQVVQDLFFRARQQLGQLQTGARLLRQQLFHGLAYGAHGGSSKQ